MKAGAPTPLEIRRERTRRKLSQRAAAALIGRSKRGWQDWEYGHRRADPALFRYWLTLADSVVHLQPKPGRTS